MFDYTRSVVVPKDVSPTKDSRKLDIDPTTETKIVRSYVCSNTLRLPTNDVSRERFELKNKNKNGRAKNRLYLVWNSIIVEGNRYDNILAYRIDDRKKYSWLELSIFTLFFEARSRLVPPVSFSRVVPLFGLLQTLRVPTAKVP